jgi:hypothetical protein
MVIDHFKQYFSCTVWLFLIGRGKRITQKTMNLLQVIAKLDHIVDRNPTDETVLVVERH